MHTSKDAARNINSIYLGGTVLTGSVGKGYNVCVQGNISWRLPFCRGPIQTELEVAVDREHKMGFG